MKRKYNKGDLIFIALIYNYVANQKTILSADEISNFLKTVDSVLKRSNSNFEIANKEKLSSFLVCRDIKKQRYILEHPDLSSIDTDIWYDAQPIEILSATLCEKALEAINVDKEALRIEKQYVRTSGNLGIYSLEYKRACNSAIEILNQKGYKNIKIANAIPANLDADNGYKVSYMYDKPYEKADVSVLIKKTNN